MAKVRIWKVVYGDWTTARVTGENFKVAAYNAIRKRAGEPYNRVQDITEIVLESEAVM